MGTGAIRENPQGGGVFIHPFNVRLAEIKTPPLLFLLLITKKHSGFQKIQRGVGFLFTVSNRG